MHLTKKPVPIIAIEPILSGLAGLLNSGQIFQ